MRMPPEAAEFHGRDAVLGFFAGLPEQGRLELVATAANGQPALAGYLAPDRRPFGLMVLTLAEDGVTVITGFQDAGIVELVNR